MSKHYDGDVRDMISLRKYAPQDLADVTRLCGELGYPASEFEIAERMKQIGPSSSLLVAVDDGTNRVVGWIELLVTTHIISEACVEIGGLVVSEAVRSRGVGKLLVEAAEEMSKQMGIRRVRVRSNVVRNRAHAFYERLGYKEVKTSKVFEKAM